MSNRPTFSEILYNVRERYRKNPKRGFDLEDGNLFIIWVIRPLSIYMTPLFVMLGISANAATWTGAAFGLVGSVLIATGVPICAEIGVWLYLICFIFDHIDGNIARYYGKTNHYGKFLDGTAGLLVEIVLYLSMGIGAYRYYMSIPEKFGWPVPFEPSYLLLAGGLAAVACVTTSYMSLRYSTAVKQAAASVPPKSSDTAGPTARVAGVEGASIKAAIRRIENMVASVEIPLLFAAVYSNLLAWYVVLIAIYRVGMCALNYVRVLYGGRITLGIRRDY